jgi:UDP-N-acetylmuramate dehydrogenase
MPAWILENEPIAKHTYYRIGGVARYFAIPESYAHVREAILFAQTNNLPLAFLGKGSNSLFSDAAFDAIVVSFERLNHAYWETPHVLYAEAGVENTIVAALCKQAKRKGAAWMHKLPGQVGATVRMNARCFGGEISQIALEIITIDLRGNMHTHAAKDVFLGYKDTTLMQKPEAVVAVRFSFPHTESEEAIASEMASCENSRNAKHHFDAPSCGSTFKNNYDVGVPSGQIFDELGFRGMQEGGAKVSIHHANFIQNTGNATANDVLTLAASMKKAALEKRNAPLSLEVEAIGVFPTSLCKACGISQQASDSQAMSWAGLAWHPQQKRSSPETPHFPCEIFSAPFLEYFCEPLNGEPSIKVSLSQLMPLREAAASPQSPFLRWQTDAPSPLRETVFPLVPQQSPGSFLNELWNYSVSEIFFEHPTRTEYDEYEVTPHCHWIAIAHSGKRIRKPGHENPAATYFPNVVPWSNKLAFGIDFSYSQVQHLVQESSLRILCALSLGNGRYFLSPHWKDTLSEPCGVWKNNTPPQVKADFHQPNRWWTVTLLNS